MLRPRVSDLFSSSAAHVRARSKLSNTRVDHVGSQRKEKDLPVRWRTTEFELVNILVVVASCQQIRCS